jgi:hypothetical protein
MRWLEILLIALVFFVVGGDPAPHENEAHYLCRLKHYWNPDWCAGDLFLESADAQMALIWSLGWLTRFFSLPAVAWIGRAVAWTLLAWGWQRLSWRLVQRPWASVLTAAIFVSLNFYLHLAGEWVVGGVEGKCFAYAFVLLALSELVEERLRVGRILLFLGAATAFHPLVGGWSFVCMAYWLCCVRRRGVPTRNSWLESLAGGLLALIGLVPAAALTWGQPHDVVAEAARIYVFERLPHHLAILRLPPEEIALRLVRHGVLLASMWLIARMFVSKPNSDLDQCASPGINRQGLRRMVLFSGAAALLAAIGICFELAFWDDPLKAASAQRYYWYRLTDFAAPMSVSLLVVGGIAASLANRRRWSGWALTAAVAISGGFLLSCAGRRLDAELPPADRRLRDPAAWQDVCHWIAANTDPAALFLTPRTNQTFKWHAGRAEVVTRKDVPQDAQSIVEWFRRYREIHNMDENGQLRVEPTPSLGHLGTERVKELADEYGFDYVVTDWRKPLLLPHVYPNVAYLNSEYVVYQIPKRGADRNDRSRR